MKPSLARTCRHTLLALLAALPASAAIAQYKIVAPDGSTTYTDRPPANVNARITALARSGAAAPAAPDASMPIELRQVAQRYPVTLYTATDCAPCDSGRRLLQQRGVPFNERLIATDDDAAVLERAVGGRTVPSISIGAQPLRGFSETDWAAYLDAAGYPRESRLPRNWPAPVATPLAARAAAVRAAAAATPLPAQPVPPTADTPGGVRF